MIRRCSIQSRGCSDHKKSRITGTHPFRVLKFSSPSSYCSSCCSLGHLYRGQNLMLSPLFPVEGGRQGRRRRSRKMTPGGGRRTIVEGAGSRREKCRGTSRSGLTRSGRGGHAPGSGENEQHCESEDERGGEEKGKAEGEKGHGRPQSCWQAAARRRGCNVLPRAQCLVCVGARALRSSHHHLRSALP